jgi:hypothetical protein
MKENHLMLEAAVARMLYWTDCVTKAKESGNEVMAREAERFVAEYTTLIAQMQEGEAKPGCPAPPG